MHNVWLYGNIFYCLWYIVLVLVIKTSSFADEPRKLQVVINPVETDRVPQTASVDEIKKITGNLSLSSPSSMVSSRL